MGPPPICYQSKQATVYGSSNVLDESDTNGIKCTWSVNSTNVQDVLTWKFDWGELYIQGVDRITGYINVKERNNYFQPKQIEVDLIEADQPIMKTIEERRGVQFTVSFEYSLSPHYTPPKKISYDAVFTPSDMNDTVLVIEGKKLHVNKVFLSYQSEFFKALFSKNFKEGRDSEIVIKEVSYDDFGLLCSSFYPNPQFPNDRTVEKLLMMARRFLLSSVIAIVEYHLIHNSRIGAERMIWLADEYGMPLLLEKCIRQLNSLEKAKKLEKSEEFEKLSDKTRSVFFFCNKAFSSVVFYSDKLRFRILISIIRFRLKLPVFFASFYSFK
ncbi:unnamed protein product [Caenorhabditis nigoni]